jgi:hypothetical protein
MPPHCDEGRRFETDIPAKFQRSRHHEQDHWLQCFAKAHPVDKGRFRDPSPLFSRENPSLAAPSAMAKTLQRAASTGILRFI